MRRIAQALDLDQAADRDPASVGGKAAALGRLAAAGFAVPPGIVLPAELMADPHADLDAMLADLPARLGPGPFAVRSSAAAEDLAEASFAGQYDTLLNVPAERLADAARTVATSDATARIGGYQPGNTARTDGAGVAVLVQPMIDADAAGVAFTADPVTGDRDLTVVTAVRGLGERLVAGEARGDEWAIPHSGPAHRRHVSEHAVTEQQVRLVAHLARAIAAHAGRPQDIEWALTGGQVVPLQARPMTALPEPVTWYAPGSGLWLRNFRIGEWLPEPVTPLFADWLLPLVRAGWDTEMLATAGAVLPFGHALVHGWYYTTPQAQLTPPRLLRAIIASRGWLPRFAYHALIQPMYAPATADQAMLHSLHQRWSGELLPEYRQLVAAAERDVDTAGPQRLTDIVEGITALAGRYLWLLAVVGGAAWKMEATLARFAQHHLPDQLPDGVTVLLTGLPDAATDTPEHAVYSLDPYHPTAGEQPHHLSATVDPRRHQNLVTAREATEATCRHQLAKRGDRLAQFDALLTTAQRYAHIRETQARDLTLGWPVLRRAIHRLGDDIHARHALSHAGDIHFCTYADLRADNPLDDQITERRERHERERRLTPPLELGREPRLVKQVMAKIGINHTADGEHPEGAVAGQPASPGRATGTVRILHTPNEADRLQPGDILVAPTTTPAWTPLFAAAAAVVTDGGTVAAHASLVAREYGIPAVVGTGNATQRLTDGSTATVDGANGHITPAL